MECVQCECIETIHCNYTLDKTNWLYLQQGIYRHTACRLKLFKHHLRPSFRETTQTSSTLPAAVVLCP